MNAIEWTVERLQRPCIVYSDEIIVAMRKRRQEREREARVAAEKRANLKRSIGGQK